MFNLESSSQRSLANDLVRPATRYRDHCTIYDELDTAEQCIERLFQDATNREHSFRTIKAVSEEATRRFDINLSTIRNFRDQNRTLLHVAAGYGRKSWVHDLISSDEADVNAQDDKGQAPLHAACHHAHKTIAQMLIEQGADVNIRDNKGWTPMHFALARKENSDKIQPHFWEVVELLLECDADPYILTKTNPAINCFARIKDSEQRRCVRILHLLNKLKSCDFVNPASREEVIDKYLRVKDFFELVKIGDDNIEILQEFLTKRLLNSHLETCDNITPLHRAAGHNHLNVAKLFIESGAEVNSPDRHGRIPLHNAAQYGHVEMIELLVSEGSDVNGEDLEGKCPLHVAAQNSRSFIACQTLIDLGASRDMKTNLGEIAYDLAESDEVREVLKLDKQRATLIPSTFDKAVYMSYQGDNFTDDPVSTKQHYMPKNDNLMLDSSSDKRLFDNRRHPIKLVTLEEDDPKYQQVRETMMNTIVGHASDMGGRFRYYEIISIEQILNEKVWKKYRLMCQRLEIEYGKGSKNEHLLFHGSNFIDRIKSDGFDERYAQRGGMFGAGLYFALHSSKSNQYTFGFGQGCQAHQNKSCYECVRKMIYAQVALGRSLESKEAMPECAHAPPGYSSISGSPQTTEGLTYPEYVIYSGDQAYPLFQITYRIKP